MVTVALDQLSGLKRARGAVRNPCSGPLGSAQTPHDVAKHGTDFDLEGPLR